MFAKMYCATAFPMMGVIQIYILLANTTWCTKKRFNGQQRKKKKNPIYEKGHRAVPANQPSRWLYFPSISLGLFGRYLTTIL